jgi:hypothetical protein
MIQKFCPDSGERTMLLTIQPPLKPAIAQNPDLSVQSPAPKGLRAVWEKIDGKLVCRWLKHPD